MSEVPLNSARKVRSGREEGCDVRYSIVELAAVVQLMLSLAYRASPQYTPQVYVFGILTDLCT